MARFAKLFELENNEQGLFYLEHNSVEEDYEMKFITDMEGVQATLTFKYDTQEGAKEGLNISTQEKAQELRNNIEGMLKGE